MKILVIGSGGREHALADACRHSTLVQEVFVAPGSKGMEDVATCVDIDAFNISGLITFAKEAEIGLVIVGPEDVLAIGIVDAFEKEGIPIFGPSKAAAQIEASKDFAKSLMKKYSIPTAKYRTFSTYEESKAYIEHIGVPIVIKENGLKAGKGVTVAFDMETANDALNIAFSIPNNQVVIEEYLVGFEFSLMCFVHQDLVIPMEVAQDHKCVFDGDKGPNTGGMGAYSPVNKITSQIIDEAMNQVMVPLAKGMVMEGIPFTGFLYGGLMLCDDGIKTIEFNARFGDPEAEIILPRLESDFVDVILKVMRHEKPALKWSENVTLGVVLASNGYPESSTKGAFISGLDKIDSKIYHMGTRYQDGSFYTDGGRVLTIVASAPTMKEAYEKVYEDIRNIECDSLFYRKDIGMKDMGETQ